MTLQRISDVLPDELNEDFIAAEKSHRLEHVLSEDRITVHADDVRECSVDKNFSLLKVLLKM